ncbi:DUF1810 domain-containing protein [Sphingobium sp. AR-3-1]|uniref:DUF1810 domain-containing protein n=1 Tax=Sphingobium psychrophilum TaxID=2728834 RepID=A0A7X9ZW79_9SPHN|nr:DUF1810 family protein [Sphingobium psychrophilum]NML13134.1 DUF1810 domain-containing protein [Sphingobium psychrophilum]
MIGRDLQRCVEARDYLDRPLLGSRYVECAQALDLLERTDAVAVFGAIDAMKLRSSLTLFKALRPFPLLANILKHWFGGARDLETLRLLHTD